VCVQQRDWDNPICAEWVAVIEEAVNRAGPDVVLVAHGPTCLAVAHWAAKPHSPIRAALLVAVFSFKEPDFPDEAVGFSETPTEPFSFRATVVVSADDPYGSPVHSEQLAAAWGSLVVHIGS
jgi:predicted alpha/beta hydrolase family esterase